LTEERAKFDSCGLRDCAKRHRTENEQTIIDGCCIFMA